MLCISITQSLNCESIYGHIVIFLKCRKPECAPRAQYQNFSVASSNSSGITSPLTMVLYGALPHIIKYINDTSALTLSMVSPLLTTTIVALCSSNCLKCFLFFLFLLPAHRRLLLLSSLYQDERGKMKRIIFCIKGGTNNAEK